MSPSPLHHFLPLLALILFAAAAECAPPDAGLPVGTWRREHSHEHPGLDISITNTVAITSDGRGHEQHTFVFTWKFGYQIARGKFAGRTRVSWTVASDARKVARVGNEIYIYPDPARKDRLLASDPPGYSLEDYQSLGGALSQKERVGGDDPNMIDIFRIQGRDLLLLDSIDHQQYLFPRVK